MNPHLDPKLLHARIRELESLLLRVSDQLSRAVQVIHATADKDVLTALCVSLGVPKAIFIGKE